MGVVIIPSNYEQLPEAHRRTITPIYIESRDRHGNLIDPGWFDLGVAPIHGELVNLAWNVLGDRRMVSDIAQPSVHQAWRRHGCDLGDKPHGRVWRRAVEEARNMARGGWRERKGRVINWTLDQFDREISPDLDERDPEAVCNRKILLGSMKKTMREQGDEDMIRIHNMLLAGFSWDEIGTRFGKSADAIKHRFHRHATRTFRATA